ncbi:MAG: hypothetical protein EXS09_20840 [Gemmataceae bacterium]|nr:hypothetical protein [Gemmataceae bacterium]
MTSATNVAKRSLLRHWANGMNSPSERELHCRVNQEAFLPDGTGVLLAGADGSARRRHWSAARPRATASGRDLRS